MTVNSKAVTKYLREYSSLLPEEDGAVGFLPPGHCSRNSPYQQALVIPAFAETPQFLERLAGLGDGGRSLVIVIINCPRYADADSKTKTQALDTFISQHLAIENVREGVTFGQINSSLDLLSLNITEQRSWLKPLQSGVGFARKVGMDVALGLWQKQRLLNPWVLSSDADAFWPDRYLSCLARSNRSGLQKGAVTLNFRHQHAGDTAAISPAAALYELSLRYYVLGLRWAGSPWAYHTVGSVLGIHCESYAEVRGFPVREAGEDFYLLNKIAKTAPVHCPATPVLALSDRISDRVPFGTGPAVKRITGQEQPEMEFKLYSPKIFNLLRQWHHSLPQIASEITDSPGKRNVSPARTAVDSLPPQLQEGLQHLGLTGALAHCQRQAGTQAQAMRYLWQWFDGFRTLKLVHWLRDHGYESITYGKWCDTLTQPDMAWLPITTTANKDPISLNQQLITLEDNTLPFQGGLNH